MTKLLTLDERVAYLLLIQDQLSQWVVYAPEWYVQLHGMTSANIALQRIKQLIAYELQVQSLEESMDILLDASQSLGLYNEI